MFTKLFGYTVVTVVVPVLTLRYPSLRLLNFACNLCKCCGKSNPYAFDLGKSIGGFGSAFAGLYGSSGNLIA